MTHFTNGLTRWLEIATRGLPSQAAQIVHDEISAHYADAVAEHQATGKTKAEARRAAMADLGDARATARALRDTHLARRRYAIAAAVSLIYPVTIALMPTLYDILRSERASDIIYLLSVFVPASYALRSLRVLLRLEARRIDRPISMVIWGLVAWVGAELISWLILGHPAITGPTDRSLWDMTTFPEATLDLAALSGTGLMGSGMLLLSSRLTKLEHSLYGLRLLMRPCLTTVAVLMIIGIVQNVLEVGGPIGGVLSLVNVLGLLALAITFLLLTLIFFRAAYRGPARPIRTA